MARPRILSSETDKGLEKKLSKYLDKGARVVNYAIHPGNFRHYCLVLLGEGMEETNGCWEMERPFILGSLEHFLDDKNSTFNYEGLKEAYGSTPQELVEKFKLYRDIRRTPVGRAIALLDIQTYGWEEAAERQGYTMRETKKVYHLTWKELAQLFKVEKRRKIDYEKLAEKLGISFKTLIGMDRRLRYDLYKRQRRQ